MTSWSAWTRRERTWVCSRGADELVLEPAPGPMDLTWRMRFRGVVIVLPFMGAREARRVARLRSSLVRLTDGLRAAPRRVETARGVKYYVDGEEVDRATYEAFSKPR